MCNEDLIASYIAGTLTEEESAQFQASLNDEEFVKELKETAMMNSLLDVHFSDDDELFDNIRPSLTPAPIDMEDEVIKKIKARKVEDRIIKNIKAQRQKSQNKKMRFVVLSIAAMIIIGLYLGLSSKYNLVIGGSGETLLAGEIITPNEKLTLTGKDGGAFTLSKGSHFSYTIDNNNINFFLKTGELHVDVPPGKREYYFIANDSVVKVTGTRFILATTGKATAVEMEKGSVELQYSGAVQKLKVGEAALLKDKEISLFSGDEVSKALAFIRNPVEGNRQISIIAEADSYIRKTFEDIDNFGSKNSLLVTNSGTSNHGTCRAYLSFDLSKVPESFSSVKLRLYAHRADLDIGKCRVYLTNKNTWTEKEITWKNAPLYDKSTFVNIIPVTGFNEVDLTKLIQNLSSKDKRLSIMMVALVLSKGKKQVHFASKEHEKKDWRPTLIFTSEK